MDFRSANIALVRPRAARPTKFNSIIKWKHDIYMSGLKPIRGYGNGILQERLRQTLTVPK